MKRILITGVNWLGDSLFTLPFIRAVRENFQDSFIAIMVVPRVAEVYQNNPHLNEIIIYDEKGKDKPIGKKIILIDKLKEKNFDTAFILRPSFSRTLLCYCSGIRERIGFSSPKNNFLLTKKISPILKGIHRIDQNLKILESLNLTIKDRIYHLEVNQKDSNFIKDLLLENGIKEGDKFIVINSGGNWPNKRWDYRNFAALADKIINELDLKVVFSGAVKDVELINQIQCLMQNKILSLCAKTNLLELAALMKMASLVISNDSGPMHLAAAVGTRVVALFGPTSPLITGPYPLDKHIILQEDVSCQAPCYAQGCKNIRCMQAISVDEVFESAKNSINK